MLELDYDLLSPEVVRDPYRLYTELRAAGRAHWSSSLGGWVLPRYDEARWALNEPRLSAARYDVPAARRARECDRELTAFYASLGRWFTFADPPLHTRLRRLTGAVLLPRMKQAEGEIDARFDAIMRELENREEIDVIADVSYPLSLGVIGALLGVEDELLPRLGRLSGVLEDFIGGALNDPGRRDVARAALDELDETIGLVVARRRSQPQPDLLTDLAQGVDRGEITSEELLSTVAMLVFAGHGTTTHLIANGVLTLLRHPAAGAELAAVEDAATLPPSVVEELLRFDSPVQLPVRYATERLEIGGHEVEPGARIFPLLGSANHDELAFDRPATLDLHRHPNRHLSFGFGIHFCLGAPLARREAPPALVGLMRRRPELAIPESELQWQPTIGYRKLVRLPVRLTGR
jgi:cytochrome P450